MGGRTKTFADVGSNVPSGYEYPHSNLNDMKFHSIFGHGFNMSQEDVAWPSRASDSRTGSSGSK